MSRSFKNLMMSDQVLSINSTLVIYSYRLETFSCCNYTYIYNYKLVILSGLYSLANCMTINLSPSISYNTQVN